MTATQPRATAENAPRGLPVRRATLVAALVCLVSFAAFWAAQRAAHVSMIDLTVYRAEGWTVRNGGDLYAMRVTHAQLPNTYPPFAALLFTPLTLLGTGACRIAATLLNLGLLVALAHLSLRLAGPPRRLPPAAAALAVAAAAVWCEPVWTTLRYGQINLLLAVLVLWDLTRRGSRTAGIGVGIAAGIKLTPLLFVLFLAIGGAVAAWRRREKWNAWLRQAAVAFVTFAATAGLSALVLPRDSRRFWTGVVFSADRAGNGEDTANQSLRGVLARALHTGDPGGVWLLAAVAVAAAGLAVAAVHLTSGEHAWAVLSCAVTGLLVSPVSWSHHWVWAVPLLVFLAGRAPRGRRPALRWGGAALFGLLFCSYALWLTPHGDGVARPELHQSAAQMALSAVYPAAGAAFLCLAAAAAWRGRRDRATEPA
ncbi:MULTISPECIES: glycosyltransferase 87 family protein [unclassified Streptomyces]|uniref:glycosyltransferase 87 family protein n=1 Tax=unclassified Streptomyces TaxID=2593676 RepID=UPI0003703AED|nr:glycosyltransferase 87 family protein [Streptomyces sp. BoleA5]